MLVKTYRTGRVYAAGLSAAGLAGSSHTLCDKYLFPSLCVLALFSDSSRSSLFLSNSMPKPGKDSIPLVSTESYDVLRSSGSENSLLALG